MAAAKKKPDAKIGLPRSSDDTETIAVAITRAK